MGLDFLLNVTEELGNKFPSLEPYSILPHGVHYSAQSDFITATEFYQVAEKIGGVIENLHVPSSTGVVIDARYEARYGSKKLEYVIIVGSVALHATLSNYITVIIADSYLLPKWVRF